ncbi:hypothetical protein ETU08_05460 [Apibacter muscae]|uniref:Uncharacterized protein n=1 Tax=Apibacter muscae TaxID=2509004 RepID=A0A563DFI7_9FLAO|nr:hypothetical protein [Apibacter muscae]TWP24430.1 hypothetical protein ETU10_04090 [Apibacter muscae]TWP28741.1 hypothetical protein ETU09_05345 [Apibacter muscae]TWP30007.1 hypothetical protein ETU08_05460 [Apibacter muscae]
MFIKLYKNKKQLFLLNIFIFISQTFNCQVAIGTPNVKPYPSTDLTLTSNNKGFVPNRVSLTGLNDIQTIPNIKEGGVVYNTNITSELGNGLYVWDGTQWNRLLMDPGKRQDYQTLVYKQTGPTDITSLTKDIPQEISSLTTNFQAPLDGLVYISTLIYAYANVITPPNYNFSSIGNTFFTINTTEIETGKVTTFYSGCTPLIIYNPTTNLFVGNFPVTAPSISKLEVKKDYNYEIKITGVEGWNQFIQVNVGTFNNNSSPLNNLYSTVKVDFISNPH